MTNCYWVEEVGATELCSDGNLPPLPGDYVVWDETPAVLAGRTISATFPRGSAWIGIAANPDVIVFGCNSNWGTYPTLKSYLVCVSSDHGFTWQGYDKYPFAAGSGSIGYGASYSDAQWRQHFGTSIAYDEEGGEFFSVESTKNDETDSTAKLRTSKSTDGVNWTTELITDNNYTAIVCDAYNGTVWYAGYNEHLYWDSVPFYESDKKMSLRASDDDGATWAGQSFGSPTYDAWDSVLKELVTCSANAQGLHVINNAYDGFDTNMYYIRPTSKTTWAAPVILWNWMGDFAPVQIGAADFLIASRARPGEIYAGTVDEQTAYYSVTYRRSTDNGLNWSTAAVAWIGDATYDMEFSNSASFNGMHVVELDDGRLVLVTLGYHAIHSKLLFGYAINSDGLATEFGPITILQPDGIDIYSTQKANYTPRFEAAAKGNDVVIAWCNDSPGSGADEERSLVFRP